MDLLPTIKAAQTELKKRGLYKGEIDGLACGQTWAAISNALGIIGTPPPGAPAIFDPNRFLKKHAA